MQRYKIYTKLTIPKINVLLQKVSTMERKESTVQATAGNGRFGASGGVVSYDTEQVTSSFALVPTFPIPPPAAKPQNVVRQRGTQQRGHQADF